MKQKTATSKAAKPQPWTGQLAAGQRSGPAPYETGILVALVDQGRWTDAAAFARTMTSVYPRYSLGWEVLGTALRLMGRSKDALAPMKRAAALAPDDAGVVSKLGVMLQELGQLAEAEACQRRAVQLAPHSVEAHGNLGVVLESQGRFAEAAASYRKVLELRPDSAQACYNLGNALRSQGHLAAAADCYRRVLQILPGHAAAHSNLGIVCYGLGRLEEAESCHRRALQLRPDDPLFHNNLGNTLKELDRPGEAEACYRRALQLKPDFAEAHCHLGFVLQDLLRIEEAQACFRRALEIKPDYPDAHGVLLFSKNYVEQGAEGILDEARRYGRMVSRNAGERFESWQCADSPERLRVGLVSGDLRQHPVGHFLEGVLANIDPARLELFAYPTTLHEDELSARIKPRFAAWHPLWALSDAAAAQRIHGDRVHILVDLSGHTAHNRLPLFARKPAPVQVSWLGYLGTTGVAEMDYVLGDPQTIPAQNDGEFSEAVWRLPESYCCFTPPEPEFTVNSLPALANACLTFGSFNNLAKMNDAVVALWSRILLAMPGSRLLLKASQFREASARDAMSERFARQAVDPTRLIMRDRVPRAEYLVPHQEIDIALDPFPYPGITSTVESLWMGVPVLTLAGNRFLSRQGVGLLANAGLPDWIAADADDYVAKAAAHATDLPRLAALRRGLRQQVLASPLFDAPRFARHFEDALQGMWAKRSARSGAA